MTLNHRLKKIEREIVPRPKSKLWIIRDSYNGDRADLDGKKRLATKTEAIKEGKVKNRDGTFYNPGDPFFIIARIFTDENPNEPSEPDIEERIEILKKRKQDLERKIKEKGK